MGENTQVAALFEMLKCPPANPSSTPKKVKGRRPPVPRPGRDRARTGVSGTRSLSDIATVDQQSGGAGPGSVVTVAKDVGGRSGDEETMEESIQVRWEDPSTREMRQKLLMAVKAGGTEDAGSSDAQPIQSAKKRRVTELESLRADAQEYGDESPPPWKRTRGRRG